MVAKICENKRSRPKHSPICLCLQDGDDKEEDEEKETDKDGFFVPHGYLSDDEGIDQEQEGSDAEDDHPDKPPPSSSGELNVCMNNASVSYV